MPELPLVLFAHHADAATVEGAAAALDGVARVAPLPQDARERAAALGTAEALLVGKWKVPREEFPLLARLRFVQRIWAGAETLPFDALLEVHPDVVFAGNPGPNAPQVAEHALALYLDCAKRITERDARLREGRWTQETPSDPIAGTKVAVAGWGAVGRRVGRALQALEADVVAVTRTGTPTEEGVPAVTVEGLRRMRGTVAGLILSLPLTDRTAGLVDAAFLGGMREDAILVNVARGRLVAEADLHAHLVAHPSFRAGLDVWWHYPDHEEEPFRQAHDFAALPNVVMTPHCAFHVPGARAAMIRTAAENVSRFLKGRPVRGRLDPGEHADI